MICSIFFLSIYRVHHKHSSIFYRMAALEARASKRLNWTQTFYLPVIFFAYGLLLGTAYFQQEIPHVRVLCLLRGQCSVHVPHSVPLLQPSFGGENVGQCDYQCDVTIVSSKVKSKGRGHEGFRRGEGLSSLKGNMQFGIYRCAHQANITPPPPPPEYTSLSAT